METDKETSSSKLDDTPDRLLLVGYYTGISFLHPSDLGQLVLRGCIAIYCFWFGALAENRQAE